MLATAVFAVVVEVVLRALPLANGWRDSTTSVVVTLGGLFSSPTQLAVTGEEQIRVPGGTYDCWVVSLHADAGDKTLWVSKRDPLVVKSVEPLPSMGNAQLVTVLTRR